MGCGASKDTGAAAPAAAPSKPTPGGPAPARAAPAAAPADPPAAAAAAPKSTPAPENDGKFKLPEIESSFDAWLQAQLDASPADGKDTDEFKYITFTEVPPFTDKHKSLMRKTMTPELFAQLKDVKSSKGYTLSNGMQAGVLRPHLGVGFTCGDEECFELFKDVINPIVKGWHNFDPATQTHTSDLDFSKLVFTEEDAALFAKYVKSTRVRAARNISGFSLPAGSSKEDRLAVEEVLKEAFGNLPDELKGTYYPLGELSSEQEDALQAGGFLFQKPGPMQLLGAAGAGRDWPSGRGIFHNPDKTVLCWCNEEDQCRIIAMENGGDIKGVFTRFCHLSNAIKDASEKAGKKLMEHPNYGFLGTCPSNLGTGLRASVMIVLPELNKDVHKLEEICAGFDLQPRGSSGEHSAAVGAKWDVSNKQRIGFSEVELVQKMIDGVKKLIALEEEMAKGSAPAEEAAPAAAAAVPAAAASSFKLPEIEASFDAWLQAQLDASPADGKDTDEFKYITFTEVPPFTDKHKSLMRKTMTPELFAQLKDVKSSKGYTLSNGMQAGVLRPHLGVGFTCGDEECFELFKDVINPIVKGWHNFDPATQTHTSDLDFSKLVFTEEDAALFAKYVKSTRVRAARNISGFSLPAGSSKEDRLAVEGVLKEAFGNLPDELKGTYYPLGELSSEQEDALQAGGFLFQKPGPMQLLGAAGAGRDWPSGRGIFHNPDKTVLCWCNEEDQCRIIAMENGGDIKGVFTRFCHLSNAIKDASEKAGKKLMEHPNYGFLGTCPSNLGTGLRASVMIVLPELNKDVHKLEEICAGFDLQPRGSSGEHSAAVGAKWDVSNKQRIGFSEVELVQKMIDGVKKLIALEEEMAKGSAPAEEAAPAAAAAAPAAAASSFKLPEIEASFDAWLQAQLDASPADGKDTDEFKYITFTEVPPFTDKHKSLMRKTMTPELFAQLKDVKSSKGYTLSNGMQAGVLRPHLGVGFTCGDEECFELFKDVINPIVKGWHNFDPATQTHTSDLDFSKLVFTEEDAALFAKYVKSTRVRAARNISGFSLPAGSSKEDRLAVEGVLKEAFGNLPDELKGTYYPLGELSSEQEDALQAGGFLFQKPGPMQLLGAAGAGRDWPSGRGIFHNPDKTVLCWCNEEDQCRIIAMENGGDIKGVFTRFCHLSNAIKDASEKAGKKLMEHPNYGFLGTCPSNLGTGLRASVMIVLPELNKDVHKLEEICAGFDLQPRGSSGEHSAAVGAKWDVSNKQRIGFSEVELVQKMIDGVKKLIALEEEMAAASA